MNDLEGILSGGYEIRILTGKLGLTGTTWIRGFMESCHVDLLAADSDRYLFGDL